MDEVMREADWRQLRTLMEDGWDLSIETKRESWTKHVTIRLVFTSQGELKCECLASDLRAGLKQMLYMAHIP